jgi:enoyl-CoA hydratase
LNLARTVGSNLRFERDEFNFLREQRDRGVAAAVKARESYHQDGRAPDGGAGDQTD